MNITHYYPLVSSPYNTRFYFKSIGPRGVFNMAVFFEKDKGRFNLALCVIIDGEYHDDIVTDNGDFILIMSTVAKALYHFFDAYPDAIVEIGASDDQRLRVYNTIFRRRFQEIEQHFILTGYYNNGKHELYNPDNFYQQFELRRNRT